MNNLIYLSLQWITRYDDSVLSDNYKHNKWFKLSTQKLWPPHTTSRVNKLDTPWDLAPTVCPIPKITHNELNFNKVFESIAEDFCRKAESTGRTPYVCWSGGVDSTSILVGILRVASPEFLKKLIVLHNDRSVVENAYFYYTYIDKKLKTGDIDLFNITPDNYDKILIADGEAGNQCMGHNSVQKLLYNQRFDLLNRPWRDIKNLSELLIGSNDFNIQMIKESIVHSPVPIVTGYDFLWWVNFNFKFDDVLLRKIHSYTKNLITPEQTKDFYNNSLYRFYAHPDMQIWSMLTTDIRRESLPITPKYFPKKYIYDFDQNEFWFYNKKEEGSNTDVMFNMAPTLTTVFAIDANWRKYSIIDQETRVNLGKMLFG